jgi:hypothetical protein
MSDEFDMHFKGMRIPVICVEMLPKENIIKIMDYMRENKKFTLSKEDLVEILI